MRVLYSAFFVAALALSANLQVAAQGLPAHLSALYPSWEASLQAGEGQKVRQAAEELLNRQDLQISPWNYNDQHAKVAILCIAARGAVLDGDWPGAVSILIQASAASQTNYANAGEKLGDLRRQHESKISEWKEMILPQEEQLNWLKSQPGLRSEQIKQYSEIETFISEHKNAVANSEQSIADIDSILAKLKKEEEDCAKSLSDWNSFLLKEQTEVREMGSQEKFVAEKTAQLQGATGRPHLERISYVRRLLKLDPSNAQCQALLNALLGGAKPAAAPAKTPAKGKQ